MKFQKKELILKKIIKNKYIKVSVLEEFFSIPRTSLLRYLSQLEQEGKIIKSFGEVKIRDSHEETKAMPRLQSHVKDKISIAKKVSILIKENDIIFLDAGSTTYYVAKELKNRNIIIYTNNFLIANIIDSTYKPIISFIPGTLNKTTLATASSASILYLSGIHFDKSFIGFNSYIDGIYSTTNEDESILKKTAIQQTLKNNSYAIGRLHKSDKKSKYDFANKIELKLLK